MNFLLKLVLVVMPWRLRRGCLVRWFGYEIDPTATIGWAWIFPRRLKMAAGSRIGHGSVAVHLDEIQMDEYAGIGRLNWITGFPSGTESKHFAHILNRVSRLHMGRHSAMTNRHLIDCTCEVKVGAFTTIAGFRSQILSHSIDLNENRQNAAPILIGQRSFVGTGCILLAGSALPDYSVLGAGAVLNKVHESTYTLYAGQPAKAVKPLDAGSGYFNRETGFVH